MKYFVLILLIFSIGCNQHKKENNLKKEINITKTEKIEVNNTKQTKNIKIIKEKNFKLTFENGKLIYPKEKLVILFYDNSLYSKEEERVLKTLKIKYFKTDNPFLKKYFNIKYFPTILIIDKNKITKFENFTPYEILKTEGI